MGVFEFSIVFIISLILYYVYRCFLDYHKLRSSNVVTEKDIWKFVLPVWTFIYFKELYFQ